MYVDVDNEDKDNRREDVKNKDNQERRKSDVNSVRSPSRSFRRSYFGSVMWNLLVCIICVVVMSGEVRRVDTSQQGDRMLNRLNYGLIFDYVGVTKPTTALL